MTKEFKKLAEERAKEVYPSKGVNATISQRDYFWGAGWAAEAIKGNPNLIWPEGEKWMTNKEMLAIVNASCVGHYTIRDKAQEQIDGFRSAYEYIHKCYDDLDKSQRELEQENATLRGELEQKERQWERSKE